MASGHHDGLRRMENGVIGEARARAFLAERFWILDRSVDVDGADLLIQRRLTRLHDREPPRLGVVQVKFLQNEGTTAYVPASYVCDEKGPMREFFLLVYTGVGDKARSFLLSADDIASHFSVAGEGHTHEGKYVLGGRSLLAAKFRLDSVERGLNCIEQALRLADLERNRAFLFHSTIFFAQPSLEQIEPEYLVPLDNAWGDIPKEFYRLKERARTALYRVEEFAESLHKIITASDPAGALSIAEDLDPDTRDGHLWFGKRIYDDELHTAVLRHRERHDTLREAGLLDAFLALGETIESFVVGDLPARLPLPDGHGYLFDLCIDETWTKPMLCGDVEPVPETVNQAGPWFEESGLVWVSSGRIKYIWPLGAMPFAKGGSKEVEALVKGQAWRVSRPVTDALYNARFPDEK